MPPENLAAQSIQHMIEPPSWRKDSLLKYKEERTALPMQVQSRRIPFMICHLTRAVNEAVRYYKSRACADGGNLAENYTVYEHPWLE